MSIMQVAFANIFIHNGVEWMGGQLKGKVGQKSEEIMNGLMPVRKFLFPASRP